MAEGERIVFVEEDALHRYFKLVTSGAPDEPTLDVLVYHTNRRKRRLAIAAEAPPQPTPQAASEDK